MKVNGNGFQGLIVQPFAGWLSATSDTLGTFLEGFICCLIVLRDYGTTCNQFASKRTCLNAILLFAALP